MAAVAVVDGAGAQSAERVPAVPGLAPRAPRHQHEGDQLPAAQTVPQVEGGSTTTATTQKIMHNIILSSSFSVKDFERGLTKQPGIE